MIKIDVASLIGYPTFFFFPLSQYNKIVSKVRYQYLVPWANDTRRRRSPRLTPSSRDCFADRFADSRNKGDSLSDSSAHWALHTLVKSNHCEQRQKTYHSFAPILLIEKGF